MVRREGRETKEGRRGSRESVRFWEPDLIEKIGTVLD